MSILRAKKLILERGNRPVECSKVFSTTVNARKIAQELGYVYLPNPGNTRPSMDPRAASNPYYRSRVKREVGSQTYGIDGELIFRSDEQSWRSYELGGARIQLYIREDFEGDKIKEARAVIEEINSYVFMRNQQCFEGSSDNVYELYIHKPRTMLPCYKRLEALNWPAVVQGKDLHPQTAGHYGYTRLINPLRMDGKFTVQKGTTTVCRHMDTWERGDTVRISLYVIKEKLQKNSVNEFLRSIEIPHSKTIDAGNWGLP